MTLLTKRGSTTAAPIWLTSRRVVISALLLAGLASLPACSNKDAPGQNPMAAMMAQAVPVTVAQAVERTVPVQVTAIGNGEAYSTVNVKSQVDGQIERVAFREGQDVRKGDLLFTIDKRPFQVALEQAEANLAKDQAQLKNAQLQLDRNSKLFQEGIISSDQYDQFRTNAAALAASVQADEAAVENARIQVGYCTIRSPIDGRTGNLMVHAGNLIKNNDTQLVTINQISPIYVDFSVPEQYLPQIKIYFAHQGVKVQAAVPQEPGRAEWGTLSFINNTVDTATGTILLKATFPNPEKRLWPGQFVNVVVMLSSRPHTVVVPSQAVQAGQNGHYTFVVKKDQTVEIRPVVAGPTINGETVIEKGIQAGETVVTDGQLRLFPGAKIEVKSAV